MFSGLKADQGLFSDPYSTSTPGNGVAEKRYEVNKEQ
jgi:hypothetical protein